MTQPAKRYRRVMLGRQSIHAAECLAGLHRCRLR